MDELIILTADRMLLLVYILLYFAIIIDVSMHANHYGKLHKYILLPILSFISITLGLSTIHNNLLFADINRSTLIVIKVLLITLITTYILYKHKRLIYNKIMGYNNEY